MKRSFQPFGQPHWVRHHVAMVAGLLLLLLAGSLPVPPAGASANGVVISEFRYRGPAGGNDEFVELFNTSTTAVNISGWLLQGCSSTGTPSTRATVPANTELGPDEHYLFTNSAGMVTGGDITYGTGIGDTGGVRIATSDGTAVDAVGASGGSHTCREGSGIAGIPTSNGDNGYERKSSGVQDTDDNAADFEGPKASNPQGCNGGCSAPPPPPTVTKIHEIQGAGASSPKDGQTVTIEGIVTGIDDEIGASTSGQTFPEDAGIYVQEEATDQDTDSSTSEGIFVGYVRDRGNYPLGSVVKLEGTVDEKFGFTMIDEKINTEPVIAGTATLPEPVDIDPAQAGAQDAATRPYYESLEGMRVRLATGVANSGGTNKFGELFLTPGTTQDRVFRTETTPSLLGTVDDAGSGDPSNPLRDPDGSTTVVKADLFDRVDDVVGPLSFSFDNYKLVVQANRLPTVTKGPVEYPYDELQPSGAGQVRVATFNLFNYLPVGASLDNGAVTSEEYAEKRKRLADAIDRLMERPDVVGVQEVGDLASLQDLANELGGYTVYLEEGNDNRGIDVGYLVKNTVTASNARQIGKDAPGSCSDVNGRLFDRPPLAIDISVSGELEFTVLVNHFASKAAPDSCRDAQAQYVRDRVKELEADGRQVIVLGDLNSFEDEVALDVLQDGQTTLTNQWSREQEQERYSYAFSGKLQTLDHVLITDGLDSRVEGFRYAHFDNDYYERRVRPNTNTPDGHKVSDHDAAVLTLDSDTQRPDTVIESGPSGAVNMDSATFTYSSNEEGASFECSLDGADFAPCDAAGQKYNGLAEGGHTFRVRARDASGNLDDTPASRSFTVDTRAPSGTVRINRGAAFTRTTAVTLDTGATDPAPSSGLDSMRFSNDGVSYSDWQPYARSASWTLTSGDGAKTVHAQYRDLAGNISEAASDAINLDTAAPSAKAPVISFSVPSTLGRSAIPITISWGGGDGRGSGIARYELGRSENDRPYNNVTLPSRTATRLENYLVGPNNVFRFRVRAIDNAGNVGEYAYSRTFSVARYNDGSSAVRYEGRWFSASLPDAYGGNVHHTSVAGRRAMLTFFNGTQVAWASTKGPDRGQADIYLDGAKVTTVDLYSEGHEARRVVFTRSYSRVSTHRLVVVVRGDKNPASTGTRVDIDAFAVLR